ncbi:MAG: DUF421 domain-containing protein [Armatimonadaceae bacterium]
MNPEDYQFEWSRILVGNYPPMLFLEIALRTVVIYVYTLLLVRLVGKRGIGQFTPFDFVIIIALGSAVGDPMFYPDVSLLHTMLVITLVVLLTRLVAFLSERNEKLDRLISDVPKRLVADGRLELENMDREEITRQEVFAALRSNQVYQLGQVERAYLEPSGKMSIFLHSASDPPPGLPLLPEREEEERPRYSENVPESGTYSCFVCGLTREFRVGEPLGSCSYCRHSEWARSVRSVSEQLRHNT